MDLNKVMVIGRLTRDPEVRSTPTGKSVASITIATGRQWTDQSGQKQKESEFHNVVLWGRLAEITGQYMHKASRVYAEGRLRTREWTGQDGVKRYRTEIIAENIIMLDGPGSVGASSAGGDSSGFAARNASPAPMADIPEVVEEEIKVEDIPF